MKQQKDENKARREEVKQLKAETERLKAEKKRSAEKLVDLEARSRRNNLIFHGIPETGDPNEDCHDKILSFIQDHLKCDSRHVAIQRAHRLGAPRRSGGTTFVGSKANAPRPIIASFVDFKQKELIRGKRHSLKAPYGLSEDLPLEIRNARKSLADAMKKYREEGKRATILYPCRLLVEGQIVKKVDIGDFCQ